MWCLLSNQSGLVVFCTCSTVAEQSSMHPLTALLPDVLYPTHSHISADLNAAMTVFCKSKHTHVCVCRRPTGQTRLVVKS